MPPRRATVSSDAESRPSGSGAVLRLSKPLKVMVAVACLGLAVTHFVSPGLPIDATTLGLLALAGVLLVVDIEAIDVLGIKGKTRRLEAARKAVDAAPLPAQAVAPSPPTVPPEGAKTVAATDSAGGFERDEADQLTPPIDPAERLLWGMEQVRIELIVLAGNGGYLKDNRSWHEYHVLLVAGLLSAKKVIPEQLIQPIATLVSARNDLVHGQLTGRLIESATALAMDVLAKLRAIGRNYIRVVQGDLDLYEDQALTTVMQEARGVMLVTLDVRGTILHRQVFPRGEAFARGFFTSWKWDLSRVLRREAWYRDPVSKRAKLAWSSSATFVGRHYPPQWGLEFRFASPDVGLT